MKPFKKIVHHFCSVLPAAALLKLSRINSLLPYYHIVSDQDLPHIKQLYPYKNRKEFVRDLDWLITRFKPLHPDTFAENIFNHKPLPEKSFLLSFDDGFREVHDVIAPILIEKGVPAIFFINPAFVDNKELFYRCKLSLVLDKIKSNSSLAKKVCDYIEYKNSTPHELQKAVLKINYLNRYKADDLGKIAEIDFEKFLQEERPFLTSGQIKKLQEQSFVFGGHSSDHPDYKFLYIDAQCNQTITSINFAGQFRRGPYSYFAFPHQDCNVKQEFFSQMQQKASSCLFFGIQNQRFEEQNQVFHRFNAERPGEKMEGLVKTVLTYNFFLRLLNKQKISRK